MKKKILYLLTFLIIVLVYETIQSYMVVNVEISEQEKEEINSFYEINPDSISRGNIMDLKYVFASLENQQSITWVEVVIKNKIPFEIGHVTYCDKNGKCLGNSSYMIKNGNTIQDLEPLTVNFDLNNDYKRLGYLFGATRMVDTATVFNSESIDYDFSEMTIEMEIKKGLWNMQKETEEHYIKFDEDAQLTSTKKIKDKLMNGQPCNDYEKRQVNYYFGILFHRDFDQWYDEVKEFLSENQNAVFYPKIVLNLPSYEYEEVRKINHLDEEQWIKYKEIIRLMMDLNILTENIDWV